MTTAQLQVSINSGPYTSGALTAAFSATLQFFSPDTTGWWAARWELIDFPPGMACPAGWSTDAASGAYYYQPTNPTSLPPVVNVPGSGALNWGKIAPRLKVNGNVTTSQTLASGAPNPAYDSSLTDSATIISVVSPNLGMEGLAATEASQFDKLRQWVGGVMRMFRLIDTLVGGSTTPYLSGEAVSGGGTASPTKGTMVYVDASGGTCTVNAPGLSANATWGVCDGKKGGSFSAAHGASIPNAGANIEDPNNPGVYTTNPIVMLQPGQSAIWMADPSNSFFKLVGG